MKNKKITKLKEKILSPAVKSGKKRRKDNAHLLSDVAGNVQNRHLSIEEYLQKITGLKGHFAFLNSGRNKVAVFRLLSFIPPDDLAMVRAGILYEVTPKVQSSVSNGFLVGEVRVDSKSRITKGLDANHRALLDYLLKEHIGTHVVEKPGTRLFKIHYPGNLVEILIARAAQITGATPVAAIKNHCWSISVGNIRFEVERFRESCLVSATLAQFLGLVNADAIGRKRFVQISRPSLLWAFGRTIDVSGTRYYPPERQNLLSDQAFWHLLYAYEPISKNEWNAFLGISLPTGKSVKPIFLAGKRIKLSPRWVLPEITGLPVPKIEIPECNLNVKPTLRGSKTAFHVPSGRGQELFLTIAQQQYEYLRGCIVPQPVKCYLNGQRLVGQVSAVDQTIYTPVWTIDHFFNCFAMIDFDLPLAKSMILGGLINYMELTGKQKGQIALKGIRKKITTTYPIWTPLVQRYFSRTGDRKFLKQVWPLLQLNDQYLDRFYLRDGIYVGAGGFWNDYSRGPKELPFVAGIGMNSLIALQKRVILELGAELGIKNERLRTDFENLQAQINDRFWDKRLGFYFDYDHDRRDIYTAPRGGRFFGLDNLLPLFAGIVPEDRVERITYYLTSSRYYGKYPAITTDLSDDFTDERRLMVWIMTDWLVVQGLRNYRRHAIADSISRRIFNAFLKIWNQNQSLPEALSGPFGLAPMENNTLAGVGGWAGFYLYLKESLHI